MSLLDEKSADVVYAKIAFVPRLIEVGDFTIAGNLTVLGTTTLEGEVTVDDNLIVTGTTTLNGEVTVDDNLIVTGTTTLNGEVTVDNNLIVTGTTTLNGEVTVDNNLIVTGTTTLNGEVTINNNLIVTGTTTFDTLNVTTVGGEFFDSTGIVVRGSTTGWTNMLLQGIFDVANSYNVINMAIPPIVSSSVFGYDETTGTVYIPSTGVYLITVNMFPQENSGFLNEATFVFDLWKNYVVAPIPPVTNIPIIHRRTQYVGDGSLNLDCIIACSIGDALTTSFTNKSLFDGADIGSYMLLRKIK